MFFQSVATTSAQHSQSIVLTSSGHAARNSSGSGTGQRILIPQQTIPQSHSSGGLSQLNEDMILDEADSLQDRSIVMDQDGKKIDKFRKEEKKRFLLKTDFRRLGPPRRISSAQLDDDRRRP